MLQTGIGKMASCIDPLPERDCCSCGRRFQPDNKNPPGSLIYCSGRCAWDPSSKRSIDSLQREYDALVAALAAHSQKNKCEP